MKPVLRTLDEIWAQGAIDGAGDPPLNQAQADLIAAILAPWRRQIDALAEPETRDGATDSPATGGPAPSLLTVVEAAARLHISRRKLMELIASREIATIRLPSKNGGVNEHRIEPAEIGAFIARHRVTGTR